MYEMCELCDLCCGICNAGGCLNSVKASTATAPVALKAPVAIGMLRV